MLSNLFGTLQWLECEGVANVVGAVWYLAVARM